MESNLRVSSGLRHTGRFLLLSKVNDSERFLAAVQLLDRTRQLRKDFQLALLTVVGNEESGHRRGSLSDSAR